MTDGTIELTRRKILAAAGAVGAAGAGAGMGTSAFFSDTESFQDNTLVAGELDMKMGYSAYYSDWKPNEAGTPEDQGVNVTMWDGPLNTTGAPEDLPANTTGLPTNEAWMVAVDDPDQFLNNTQYADAGTASCGPDGTDADALEQPVVEIADVKPGDFGEVTFDFALCDNPGYVWLQGELQSCAENGVTEPEAEDTDENEDEPRTPAADGASLLPLLAAGAVPSASSLFDGGVRETLSGGLERAAESDAVTRQDALKAAATGAAGVAAAGAMSGTAAATPGDILGTVDLPNNGDCSVAGTWDGTYYTTINNSADCADDVMQIYEPPAGGTGTATLVAEKNIVDGNGNAVEVSALEWDPTRGKYWGAYDGTTYLISRGDPTDGGVDAVVEDSFDTSEPHGFGIVDGLAIDDNDTLWYSPDVDTQVVRYDLSSGSRGDVLNDIQPKGPDGEVAGDISGVAVGAPLNGRETLYVGQNPGPADGNIIRVYADDGEHISQFAAGTDFRVEDITCAPDLYDSEVLLVKDSDVGEYKAYEVEAGTCPLSGGNPDPDPEPDECADVELLDVVQAAAWVDDGNNYQNGDEVPAVAGSLREVLDQLGSETGLGLPGDIPAEEGGGTGRNCFSAGTTHSVSFAWWVPVDHGNEIQSDSATFTLSFYTEQCRHNDGSGQTPEPTETPTP